MTQEWRDGLHRRVATALVAARGELSAQALSERATSLGFPISRDTISNFETGRKRSLDLAELVVLAAALEIAPIDLIYPPEMETVERLPGDLVPTFQAAQWFSSSARLRAIAELAEQIEAFADHFGKLLGYSSECRGLEEAGRGGSEQHRRAVQLHDLAARAVVATGDLVERQYQDLGGRFWPGEGSHDAFSNMLELVRSFPEVANG